MGRVWGYRRNWPYLCVSLRAHFGLSMEHRWLDMDVWQEPLVAMLRATK